jgi:adenylate cyclase
MTKLLLRRPVDVVALSIALLLVCLHWWADTQPVEATVRLGEGGELSRSGPAAALLRGIHNLEGRASDVQFQLRGPLRPHPDLVVVEVDEKSARRYGLWPWRRDLVAKGLHNLHLAGARAIGLDVIFTDEAQAGPRLSPESVTALEALVENPPKTLESQLPAMKAFLEVQRQPSPDMALVQAFEEAPELVQGVVVYPRGDLPKFQELEKEQARLLEPHLLRQVYGPTRGAVLEGVDFDQVASWRNHSAQMPLARFAEVGHRLGHFNTAPDPDGTLRRLPILAKLEGPRGFLPHLTVQTAAAYYDAAIEPVFDPELGRLSSVRLVPPQGPVVSIPLQVTEQFALIDHLGPRSVFKTVSFSDAVDNTFDPELVKGKALLVGVTLIGNFDQRVTPYSEFEPGIFTSASFLSNILQGVFLTRPPAMRGLELLFMLLAPFFLARVLPRVLFRWKLLVILAVAGAWLVVDQVLFVRGLQLATVMPTFTVLLASFGIIFVGYLSVDREKVQLRSAFQHYLNESVMESMLQHPEKLKLGGEKKEMTVLFSDIRGFTTLAERMAPEALVKFINSYLTPMTRIVFEEGGTLDKYIGDALMAFWGAPVDQPDHALRACRAAIRFLEALTELKVAWREQNLPEFDIGVGINSGAMIVGNMGSDIRFDYTVMGDSVNLASRLEGTNKEYETRVLISESTHALVQGQVNARRLGAVRVKGKRRPVGIFELRGAQPPQGQEAQTIRTFETAVEAYAQRQFVEAEQGFHSVLQVWPNDPPSRRYLDEIAVFKATPPEPGWDGVYTATTK